MEKVSLHDVVLQERDASIIRMLAEEFRILTGEQIGELFPMGSRRRRNFRLKQLCAAGYLSARILSAMGVAKRYGYYLGPKAVNVFSDPAEKRAVEAVRMQAAQLAASGLAHRMLVDSVHIRFLTASREMPEYRLLTWIDQYSPWWQDLRSYGVPFQADGYGEYLMFLHFDTLYTFFLEVDSEAGTERGEALREKIRRYVAYAESGTYQHQFAAKAFRVLFIISSPRRMKGILQMLKNTPSDIFWLATWADLKTAKLFDAYWHRPNRDGRHSLLAPL